MKTNMLRGVSVTDTIAKAKTHGRGGESGDAGRAGGSLAQLESVLQRLSKHEHRTHIESVERTSAQTQQQMLKDRLLKVQEELAKSQGDKATLCEKLGALQQAKNGQQSEIDHLLVELRSSRESQAVMAKKVAQMENETLDLKRNYIRSMTCRTKTASELLSRLSISGVLQESADASKAVAASCDLWNGGKQNKRKRVEEAPEQVSVVVEEIDTDEAMAPAPPAQVPIPEVPKSPEMQDPQEASIPMPTGKPTNEVDIKHIQEHQECQSCFALTKENQQLKENAEEQLKQASGTIAGVKVQLDALVQAHGQAQEKISAMAQTLVEKESIIEQLKAELDTERLQVEEMRLAAISEKDEEMKEKDVGDDVNDRVKVLEDNLAQLNTYADHLEMLISQCASCSVKLQSEGTQESSK